MPTKAPYVSRFERPALPDLPLDGEVSCNGIWGLDSAVNSIGVESKSRSAGVVGRKSRVRHPRRWRAAWQRRYVVSARIAGYIVGSENVGRSRLRAGQTERTKLAETVDNPFTEMVVIHADTATNRSLGIWRIGNCNARGKIQFIHRPVGPASSALAGRSKREFRLISQPLSSRNGSIDEPLVEVDCRSNLLPVHFIRGLQEGVSHTYCDGQIGSYPPGILHVPFEFVGLEATRNQRPNRQQCSRGWGGYPVVVVHIDGA